MHPLDALGNTTRRAILKELHRSPLSVEQLATRFPISRPAVSRHLALLAKAGLVESREVGASNLYALKRQGFDSLQQYLDDFWDVALDGLQTLAKRKK